MARRPHPVGILTRMTSEQSRAVTVDGESDSELRQRLERELIAFNDEHTGHAERGSFSLRATDADGELIGGLTAWTWGGLCGISLLWVREDSRKDGWGTTLLQAAEAEAVRRGCDRISVSSFTFQAPGFYQRYGYAETGRMPGLPGGHADVQMYKTLTGPPSADPR